jgi:hypothetical protein
MVRGAWRDRRAGCKGAGAPESFSQLEVGRDEPFQRSMFSGSTVKIGAVTLEKAVVSADGG